MVWLMKAFCLGGCACEPMCRSEKEIRDEKRDKTGGTKLDRKRNATHNTNVVKKGTTTTNELGVCVCVHPPYFLSVLGFFPSSRVAFCFFEATDPASLHKGILLLLLLLPSYP